MLRLPRKSTMQHSAPATQKGNRNACHKLQLTKACYLRWNRPRARHPAIMLWAPPNGVRLIVAPSLRTVAVARATLGELVFTFIVQRKPFAMHSGKETKEDVKEFRACGNGEHILPPEVSRCLHWMEFQNLNQAWRPLDGLTAIWGVKVQGNMSLRASSGAQNRCAHKCKLLNISSFNIQSNTFEFYSFQILTSSHFGLHFHAPSQVHLLWRPRAAEHLLWRKQCKILPISLIADFLNSFRSQWNANTVSTFHIGSGSID